MKKDKKKAGNELDLNQGILPKAAVAKQNPQSSG
jgi:hypothetical protein